MRGTWLTTIAMILAGAGAAGADTITLDFEGLGNTSTIDEAYNGGTAGDGTSINDVGVSFPGNTLSIIDTEAGGSGDFANEPTPDTALITSIPALGATVINVEDGFDTGFSFFYSSIVGKGSVSVFDQIDGGGTEVATLALEGLGSAGNGDPTGRFDTWKAVGVDFAGTARSVEFLVDSRVIIDQVTFGSSTPTTPIPLPATLPLALCALGLLGLLRRRA